MAQLDFDATTVEPAKGFSLITPGEYTAVISKEELRDAKSGTGKYLALTFQIVSGEFQNRLIWNNFNILHAKPEVRETAKSYLAAVCRALDLPKIKDSSELLNKPLKIKIGVRKNKESGDMENVILEYIAKSKANPSVNNGFQNNQPVQNAAVSSPW